jgi:hypothetical protein
MQQSDNAKIINFSSFYKQHLIINYQIILHFTLIQLMELINCILLN